MSAFMGMSTAPRDGTIIEIECTQGYPAWRGLFKFEKDWFGMGPSWVRADDPHSGIDSGSIKWRPWFGSIENYRSPYEGFDAYDYFRGMRPVTALIISDLRYYWRKIFGRAVTP